MRRILILLLLPLAAFAQVTFGPNRLDDGQAEYFYYPTVDVIDQTQLRCTWSSTSDTQITSNGQLAMLDGTSIGPRYYYQNIPPGQIVCAADLNIVALSDGGEARLFYHS